MTNGLRSVAVSRAHCGRLQGVLYASDERARSVEELQQTVGEGPAMTALRQRSPVFRNFGDHSVSAHDWSLFLSALDPPLTGSICSSPVQFGVVQLGVLTVSGPLPTDLNETIVREVLTTSDSIGHILLDGHTDGHAPPDTDSYQLVVHQAAGMVSVQLAVSVQASLLALRGAAFSADLTVAEIARQVVRRERRFTADGSHLIEQSSGEQNGVTHE